MRSELELVEPAHRSAPPCTVPKKSILPGQSSRPNYRWIRFKLTARNLQILHDEWAKNTEKWEKIDIQACFST